MTIGEPPGEVVGHRFGDAEDDDEGEDRDAARDVQLFLGDRRKNAALHADHAPDERVDDDEEGELSEVFAEAEPYGARVGHPLSTSVACRRVDEWTWNARSPKRTRALASSGTDSDAPSLRPLMNVPFVEPASLSAKSDRVTRA